jgi:hypothetical protein
LIARLKESWDAAWSAPESPANLRASRVILAAQGLWILLSRPDIPRLASWPAAFFPADARLEFLRYGITRGHPGIEWALYGLLHVALLLVISGAAPRAACATAGLLLYHFAPFEEIIVGMPHTHFGGLTIPTVGLLILAFAAQPPARGGASSPEYRWPLTLIRLLFSFTYLFAFLGKLRYSGLLWFTGDTLRGYLLVAQATTGPVLALRLAGQTGLCWVLAIATFFFEALFPLAVFSTWARRALVPSAIAFHLGNVLALDIGFPSAPLLLLFVNWEWLGMKVLPVARGAGRTSEARNAAPS